MTATVTSIAGEDKVPEIYVLPLNQIVADDNIREKLGDLTELTESIRAVGVKQPISVSWIQPEEGAPPAEPRYRVNFGHRRFEASKKAKRDTIIAIIETYTESERIAVMIAENMRRQDLTPMEEAKAYHRAIGAGMTKKELAKRVGAKEAHVTERLALLELPSIAVDAINSGKLTLAEAAMFLRLKELPNYATEVKGLLARKAKGYTIYDTTVSDVLKKHARREKVKEAEAEAKRRGWAIVKATSGYNPTPAKGVTCERLGIAGKELTAHKKLACHGVMIVNDSYTGVKVTPVCIDPAVHKEPESKVQVTAEKVTEATTTPQRTHGHEESEEAQAQRLAAEERHREFLLQHIGGIPRAEAVAAVLQYVASNAGESDAVILNVPGNSYSELINGVKEYAARSATALMRVAYTHTISGKFRFGRWEDSNGRAEKLMELGYEPTEEELTIIQGWKDDQAAQEAEEAERKAWLTDAIVARIAVLRARWDAVELDQQELDDAISNALEDVENADQANASVGTMLDVLEEEVARQEPEPGGQPDVVSTRDDQGGGDNDGEEQDVMYAGDEDNGDEITSGPDPEEVDPDDDWEDPDPNDNVGDRMATS